MRRLYQDRVPLAMRPGVDGPALKEVAIRVLREEKALYPERFEGFHLTRFDVTSITA